MRLHNLLVLMIIAGVILLNVVGCSNGTEDPQKVTQENTETVSQGQMVALPEEKPALFGKVKDIVGNEVTVFKGEVGQNEGAPTEEPIDEEAQDKMKSLREDIQSGKITPEQAQEEMQKLGLQPNRTQNQANRMQFTEETETFIIPVGTPIVTMQSGGANEANQVGLTDIKKDTILRIWKNDDTVSFVQVMGGGTMGNRQGAGGQGSGAGGGMPPGAVIFGPAPGTGGRQ